MRERLLPPRIVVGDAEVLERRARALVAREGADEGAEGLVRLVAFRLGGRTCAVEASVVERAVTLSATFAVPLADGSERAVAFVEERPVAVADLAGEARGVARRAADLAGSPAIVVETGDGSVAVAVDGPVELAEDRMAAVARTGSEDGIRLTGILASGGALLDASWLASWAGRVARS